MASFRPVIAMFGIVTLGTGAPALAQLNSGPVTPATAPEESQQSAEDYEPERPDAGYGPPRPVERCEEDQDAAQVSGEIVVCRKRGDQSEFRIRSDGRAQSDYARETMFEGDPQAPDVAGAGIFRGPATVSGLCLIPPCPAPVMPDIDFAAIPEAPEGSDADRVGQGLAPRGNDEGIPQEPVGENDTPVIEPDS